MNYTPASIPNYHDAQGRIGAEVGERFVHHYQDIPISYRDFLVEKRKETEKQRMGELVHVASVPAVFAVKMMNEGLDPYNAPLKDIVAWIKKEGLDDFLVRPQA